MKRRPRTVKLPMRIDIDELYFRAITAGYKKLLAEIETGQRAELELLVVECTRHQHLGYTRALTIIENTDTGHLHVASHWPWTQWASRPTSEPEAIRWRAPELVDA
jgi:hypothetical protein